MRELLFSIYMVFVFIITVIMKRFFIATLISIILMSFAAWNIVIYDVWFDGTNEWIAVYNSWSIYSWMVEITWAKSSPVQLVTTWFKSNSFLIFWDDDENITQYTWNYSKNSWLSLSDSVVWELSLFLSWDLQHTFTPTKELLDAKNTLKESIKLEDLGKETVISNNPTALLEVWWLQIHKIYPYDTDSYAEHIVIKANQSYSGTVIIEGLWNSSSSKSIDIHAFTWDTISITDNGSWLNNSIVLSSISLSNQWEDIHIVWQSWQLIDNVVYKSSKQWSTLEYSYHSWDIRVFENKTEKDIEIEEPKISQSSQDNQDVEIEQLNCSIIIQNEKEFNPWDKINLAIEFNDQIIQNSSSYICNWDWLDNDAKNKCNPTYVLFPESWVFKIEVQVNKNNVICNDSIELVIQKDEKMVEEYPIPEKLKDTDSRDLTELEFDYIADTLRLHSLLPNPEWSDSSAEKIVVESYKDDIDSIWLFVKIWNKSYPLWIPKSVWSNLFEYTDSFWLKNSAACLELHDNKRQTFDKVCYNEAKTWIWYWVKENITKVPNREIEEKYEIIDTSVANQTLVYNTGYITIEAVLPNPTWKDAWKEEIHIMVAENYTWDTSWLVVNNWKTTTKVDTLNNNGVYIQTGDFWLYNSASCIRLESDTHVFDEFCYPKTNESVLYSYSNNIIDLADTKRMSNIKMKQIDDSICLMIDDNTLDCLVPSSVKKISTLENKLQNQISSSKNLAEEFKNSKNDLTSQVRFHKDAVFLINNLLKKDENYAYEWSDIQRLFSFWKEQKSENISSFESNEAELQLSIWKLKFEESDVMLYKIELLKNSERFVYNLKKNLLVK